MKHDKSRVVWIQADPVPAGGRCPPVTALREMIETGLRELTGTRDPAAGWSRYFRRGDRVGIKVNCLGGPRMCTHPALAEAAARSLGAAGIPADRILVWDRTNRDLRRCGFPHDRRGRGPYRCFGTDETGFGYERELTVQGSVGSLFSTLLTRYCTAVINMPVLKDHGLCGITASLKNVFGELHNPNKYHDDRCNPFIADACAVPFVRSKHRLVICDALVVQYKGGPSYHPQWAEPVGAVLLSEDPVALDTVCTALLNDIRARHGHPPVEKDGALPAYIETAADGRHRLGRCRPAEIDLRRRTIPLSEERKGKEETSR